MAADICIVGAGSSGIAVGKALLDNNLEFDCFEKGSNIGGMWRYGNDNGLSCAYASLHIDTSRENLGYSDFPIDRDKPDFLSHEDFLGHLEAYAERFGVRSRVRTGTEVVAVERAADGRWNVTTRDGLKSDYRALVVANGHLWDARWPAFPGEFTGQVIHSSQYRTAAPFEGKRVLVVGIGNSAVDIAVDLCRRARSVTIATRSSAHVMPKYLMGVPIDRWSAFLSRKLGLPTLATRMLMAQLIKLGVGNQERFGLPRPKHPMWREHATLSQELLPYVGHGWISVKPNVEQLAGDRVGFVDGSDAAIEAIIYATGYRTTFPFLAKSIFAVEDNQPLDLYRQITPPSEPGLYFAGLVQPIGATIPLVEVQARWIAAVLAGKSALPDPARMRREVADENRRRSATYLGSPRYTLEVDFKSYAGTLRKDIARR